MKKCLYLAAILLVVPLVNMPMQKNMGLFNSYLDKQEWGNARAMLKSGGELFYAHEKVKLENELNLKEFNSYLAKEEWENARAMLKLLYAYDSHKKIELENELNLKQFNSYLAKKEWEKAGAMLKPGGKLFYAYQQDKVKLQKELEAKEKSDKH